MTVFATVVLIISFMATCVLSFSAGMKVSDRYHETCVRNLFKKTETQNNKRERITFSPEFIEKYENGERATERVR